MVKIIKKFSVGILIISICSFMLFTTPVSAQALNNAITGAQNFANTNTTSVINPKAMYDLLNLIYGLLLGIAIAGLILRGIFIGMRMVLGTIGERVDAKKMLVEYLWIVLGVAFGGAILRAILELIMTLV